MKNPHHSAHLLGALPVLLARLPEDFFSHIQGYCKTLIDFCSKRRSTAYTISCVVAALCDFSCRQEEFFAEFAKDHLIYFLRLLHLKAPFLNDFALILAGLIKLNQTQLPMLFASSALWESLYQTYHHFTLTMKVDEEIKANFSILEKNLKAVEDFVDPLWLEETEQVEEKEAERSLVSLGKVHDLLQLAPLKTHLTFKLNTKEGLEKAQVYFTDRDITYELASQREVKVPLHLAPVALLGGELGVFANRDLTIKEFGKHTLGQYHGVRHPDDGSVNSAYNFETGDGWMIDAAKVRNFTACVNHSSVPNIHARTLSRDGETRIYYYLLRDVKEGEQLLISYNQNEDIFFENLEPPIQPISMGPTDGCAGPDEMVARHQENYCEELFSIDKKTATALNIHHTQVLLPTILFKAVFEGNVAQVKTLLKKTHHPDLATYAVDLPTDHNGKHTISSVVSHQEHITPLMLACYLGNEAMVAELLMHPSCDVDKATVHGRNTALHFLLQGQGNPESKLAMAKLLLQCTEHINLHNQNKLTLLQHCIDLDYPEIAACLLEKADAEKKKQMFEHLFEYEKEDAYVTCMLNDRVELLEILLTHTERETFWNLIQENTIPIALGIQKVSMTTLRKRLVFSWIKCAFIKTVNWSNCWSMRYTSDW